MKYRHIFTNKPERHGPTTIYPDKVTGVYKITIGHRSYYGSTNDLRVRLQHHMQMLRDNSHYNIELQAAFIKYGFAFVRVILFNDNRDVCYRIEDKYIKEDKTRYNKYRALKRKKPKQCKVRGVSRHLASGKYQARISIDGVRKVLGYASTVDEAKDLILAVDPTFDFKLRCNKGTVKSPESRAKLSKALTGRTLSDETRANMSAAKMGHYVSDESKVKMAEAKGGSPFRVCNADDGEEVGVWINQRECAIDLDINNVSISR